MAGPMVVNVPATGAKDEAGGQPWPSSAAAYFGLFAIIFSTFINFFDQTTFGMLAQRVKVDFNLSDTQLGFVGGPASVVFFLFVGIPLARLADIYPRKLVLAGGQVATGLVTALGGFAQNFVQFVGSRLFLGAGGSAHAPASYSMLADYFPPRKITRAFALLQLGFIGGNAIGTWLGGSLVYRLGSQAPGHFFGWRIFGWQWILVGEGVACMLAAVLLLMAKEPPRRLIAPREAQLLPTEKSSLGRKMLTFTGLDAAKAIHERRRVYYPLFGALALSSVENFGLQFWRVPMMVRSYGWNEEEIGEYMAPLVLVASLVGIMLGGTVIEWMSKRYKDANVRMAAIVFTCTTVCAIIAPLMPTGGGALAVMALGSMFGIAGAVPQNAAIQRVAPNAMRGQVTAFYLFMFTFFGQMGAFIVGVVNQNVIGNERELWKALVLTAGILLPIATILMYRAIRPYREEVERLEAEEAAAAASLAAQSSPVDVAKILPVEEIVGQH